MDGWWLMCSLLRGNLTWHETHRQINKTKRQHSLCILSMLSVMTTPLKSDFMLWLNGQDRKNTINRGTRGTHSSHMQNQDKQHSSTDTTNHTCDLLIMSAGGNSGNHAEWLTQEYLFHSTMWLTLAFYGVFTEVSVIQWHICIMISMLSIRLKLE